MPARVISHTYPLRHGTILIRIYLNDRVWLQRNGSDHASADVGTTPTLAAAPELNANVKIAMFHFGI